MGSIRCTPVAFGFKGPERGSKWGPVVNNGENIASGSQSLGKRPRNLRPCGMQQVLSEFRPGTPEWGLLGVPTLLWVLRGQKGVQNCVL